MEKEIKDMGIHERLMNIQQELKCNKGQYNSFGKYKYRSCEDILESVKPLLKKYQCTIVLSDELCNIGERYYIKACATITTFGETEGLYWISNTAYAREEEEKKGMDGSQITGTASSYARKYALNGLLAIDDTKDADTDEYKNQTQPVTEEDIVKAKIKKYGTKASEILKEKNKKLSELELTELKEVLETLENAN